MTSLVYDPYCFGYFIFRLIKTEVTKIYAIVHSVFLLFITSASDGVSYVPPGYISDAAPKNLLQGKRIPTVPNVKLSHRMAKRVRRYPNTRDSGHLSVIRKPILWFEYAEVDFPMK
jgi:hypothetical protein